MSFSTVFAILVVIYVVVTFGNTQKRMKNLKGNLEQVRQNKAEIEARDGLREKVSVLSNDLDFYIASEDGNIYILKSGLKELEPIKNIKSISMKPQYGHKSSGWGSSRELQLAVVTMICDSREIVAEFQSGYMTNVKMFIKELENFIERNKAEAV